MTIENDKEFSITQNEIMKLEVLLQQVNLGQLGRDPLPEWIKKVQTDGLNSMIGELKAEVAKYAKTHDLVGICE